jgi:hypothetical protein
MATVLARQTCAVRALTTQSLLKISQALTEPHQAVMEQEDALLSLCHNGLVQLLDETTLHLLEDRAKGANQCVNSRRVQQPVNIRLEVSISRMGM